MHDARESTLRCPGCGAPMRKLKLDGALIDRCDTCFGIWLDRGERLELVADSGRADVVDIGTAAKEADHPGAAEHVCPRDGAVLEQRRHPDQEHIRFGHCAQCGGSFFDAGRLRDLSRLSVSDVIAHILRL